jgi:hypothetical protein
MPPVKGEVSTKPNLVRERLLLLASLIAPPQMQPNLSYLERRTGLKSGRLKDASRNRSVPKTLAATLVDAAPGLHIEGLTADWLIRGAGAAPRMGGEMPPRVPQGERSGSGVGNTAPLPRTAERELIVGLVGDALVGAIERALERDELEHTRKGHLVLGTTFLGLAVELQKHGVDVHELVDMSHELLKRAQP